MLLRDNMFLLSAEKLSFLLGILTKTVHILYIIGNLYFQLCRNNSIIFHMNFRIRRDKKELARGLNDIQN